MPIDTKKVIRRKLRFHTLDEMVAEAERIVHAEREGRLTRLGNWTVGQNFTHIAAFMDYGYDGFPEVISRPPWFVKLMFKVMKNRFLTKGFPQGLFIPKVPGGTTGVEDIPSDQALARLRAAAQRMAAQAPPIPSPAMGPLSHAETIQFGLRHAELHMGFLVPG
ncbi:MAG: DUF1569 domain-containing protein [Phycisphaerales bacterium]